MRYIVIRTQFEGFHKYPKAPKEVKFLRSLHRHLFKVEATIGIGKKDRELEFFMVKRVIDNFIQSDILNLPDSKSCEYMAEKIMEYLDTVYPDRYLQIEVSEDGENASIVNNI